MMWFRLHWNHAVTAPPFEITVDNDAGLIRTVLRGFWTMGDLMAFGAGMYDAVQTVAARHRVFALLSDSTGFKVQSAEVSEGFEKMTAAGAAMHSGPTAIIVGSTLNKLQADRIFTDPRVRVFIDAAEARRWVDEQLAAARAG